MNYMNKAINHLAKSFLCALMIGVLSIMMYGCILGEHLILLGILLIMIAIISVMKAWQIILFVVYIMRYNQR